MIKVIEYKFINTTQETTKNEDGSVIYERCLYAESEDGEIIRILIPQEL